MKLTIQGQGDVNLTQRDFVAAGGQGQVFAQGDTAFKVYHDLSGMMPEGKIQELAGLPVPPFSRPEHLLIDAKGKKVGYTTRFVKDAYVLCQLFPRSFRDREGLTHDKAFKLVEKMREGFDLAHKAKILLIDPNEMNFLVDHKFSTVAFIDTDSYQTRSYPATAIMESIRDRHMSNSHAFNEGTDWFSFAVTSFQLLVGIHPYKGRHPALKGFEDRMKANISVFNKDVSVPAVTYPLDVIPKEWRGWYEAVLERGDRCAPPGGAVTVVLIRPVVNAVLGSKNLVFEEIGQYGGGSITGVWTSGHRLVVATDAGLWVDGRRVHDWTDTTAIAFSPKMTTPVAIRHPEDVPDLFDCQGRVSVPFGLNAQRVAGFEGRVYLKVSDKIMEVVLSDIGQKVVASTRLAASVLPNASMLFSGGVVQNMLGSTFVSLFPQAGQTYQIRIPDLDTYRVLDAKYDAGVKGGVLMVIGRTSKGTFDRLVFRFDASFQSYDMRKVEDIQQQGLNFVVTDAGVCICLNEDDKLELTSVTKGSSAVKTIADKSLGGDLQLFKRGAQVLAARGDRLYTMKMV